MLFKCLVVVFAASAFAAPQETTVLGELKQVYRMYQECAAKDLMPCLKLKLIAAMDRVARTYPELPLFDGVSFVKVSESVNEVKTEEEIEASLPRALNEKDNALDSMIADKLSNFFDTHTLQVKLPSGSELREEGRKKKKGSGFMLIPLILGGALIPLVLGGLALLAGKALIISKLALILAGIIGLKKLFSGGNAHHDSGHEVVVSSPHGSGWGRSYDKAEAQKMAYSAYAPKTA